MFEIFGLAGEFVTLSIRTNIYNNIAMCFEQTGGARGQAWHASPSSARAPTSSRASAADAASQQAAT